ncbi:hypothetical protein CPT_Sansa54 [Caulobacter phage Sansa]|uniref:Uncharacterized protein n=1 Tax=Caulobacter phage Sansa TaxID=1675600 RepID=A0A0K1LMN5_9CAUD|nr:hypothetical protein HOR07_gp054 [Caulobacter phage Sansa]AKU43458.1 hypothetical protein CPT_Sansa54 [Caulobacter phage Sansa]
MDVPTTALLWLIGLALFVAGGLALSERLRKKRPPIDLANRPPSRRNLIKL